MITCYQIMSTEQRLLTDLEFIFSPNAKHNHKFPDEPVEASHYREGRPELCKQVS